MALPHYLNSRASTKYYEPMYKSVFEVSIIPPVDVSGGELLLQHVNKISGLDTDKGSEMIDQAYKFAKRSYASGVPTGTTVDLSIGFSLNLDDANNLYVYKTLRDWWRKVYNPLTGRQGLKKDYIGTIVVVNANRAGQIFWSRTFHDAIPMGDMPDLDGDYSDGGAHELEAIVFRCDWWEENMI